MKTSLGNIATTQTGLFAKPDTKGEIVYLQAKYFDENGQLIATLHPDIKAEHVSGKHLLQDGDVVFAAKGTKNFAALYEGKNQRAVASTSFFVIRLRPDYQNCVLPEYIAWFLNHPVTQKQVKAKAKGTSIVSISKSVLEKLEVPIPDLKTQQIILSITQLRNKEKQLKQQIESLREKQIQQHIFNSII